MKQMENIRNAYGVAPEELDGYEDLSEVDQQRVRTAIAQGHVADEDLVSQVRF